MIYKKTNSNNCEDNKKMKEDEGSRRLLAAVFGVDLDTLEDKTDTTKTVQVGPTDIVDCFVNEDKKTVVLKWSDGDVTKSTCHKSDKFDVLVGFSVAYMKKVYGTSENFHKRAFKLINKHSEKKYTL